MGGQLQLPPGGPLPAGRGVGLSGSHSAARLRPVLQDCPSLRAITHVFSTGARHLVSAGGTLVLGGGRAPSPSHAQTGLHKAAGWARPARGVALCGRGAGGQALTLQSLLSPSRSPPSSLPSPARRPQPFLINGPRCQVGASS